MAYTQKIRAFAGNGNEAWLNAVREDKITAHYTFAKHTNHATFKILYKEQICNTTDDSRSAWDLLKQWGIFELLQQSGMDFVVAYEDKKIVGEDGYKMTISVVRETHISRIASKG
jgi:hypothetical protein